MAEPLNELGASFERHLRAENRAERTRKIYGQAVRFFADWLQGDGQEPNLDAVTKENITTWLGELSEKVAIGTVRIRWRGMHRFTGWLVDEELLPANPMRSLKQPTPEDKPVPIVGDDDLRALIAACKGTDFMSRRDEVIIRVLIDCGVRVSELVGLTVADLDLNSDSALVTGKGNKVRPIYFGTKTSRALDRYLRVRKQHRHASADALLLGERGPMSTDGVRDRLVVRAKEAGLEGRLHPHMLRHTFAHDFLINGGQQQDLKRIAGWSSDAMLARYGASGADLRAREAARRMRRGDRI